MPKILERFLKYVSVDTRADDRSEIIPSSEGQWTLAGLLVEELKQLGLQDIKLTKNCLVHATLPSNTQNPSPVIGLMAHLDTYPGFTSAGVKPLIHHNYQGETLVLNEEQKCYLSPVDFPDLLKYLGDDIITTDGTTLLGADDKAGIAEIMDALEYLCLNPEIPHGEIRVAFTPDEETDRGGLLALEKADFPVDFVITVDGDGIGEVNFENFNAAHAEVSITGRSVHTGEAKGRMINASRVAHQWIALLPEHERPELTEGFEGFYHIEEMSGNVEHAEIYCMIRDFSQEGFQIKKAHLQTITESLQREYGEQTLQMIIKDDYMNMKSVIETQPNLMEGVLESCRRSGIEPKVMPIRGGTDGASLAEMGILAPNLFLGGHNYHGQYEFVSLQAMEAASRVLVNLVQYFTSRQAN